jgi:hypothetical protein
VIRAIATFKEYGELPPEGGFAAREANGAGSCRAAKKGVHGGNMVSPVRSFPRGEKSGVSRTA